MLESVRIVDLPKILDERGNLTFLEGDRHIPFTIVRTYWIYDVPGGEQRGGHAFKEQEELIIALSGSLDVVLNDGMQEKHFYLNRSYFGLYIPNGLWRKMENFSTNSLVLVLSNTKYSNIDYIYDYDEYIEWRKIK